jgi:hypothetical protein
MAAVRLDFSFLLLLVPGFLDFGPGVAEGYGAVEYEFSLRRIGVNTEIT